MRLDCTAGSKLRVNENPSRLVSGYLRLLSGAPDALTHPIWSTPHFRGVLYGCLRKLLLLVVCKSSANVELGVVLCLIL